MYALISSQKIQLPPGTVVRMLGSWEDYRALQDSRGDASIPRIKYRVEEVLLMSPLPKHGRDAHLVAGIVTALLDAQNRNYEAFTPITMELPEQGGIEPDYCFYIDNWQGVVGRDRLNWGIDPWPDLAIEIDVTNYTDVNDYLLYRLPEVWLCRRSRLAIYRLQDNEYRLQETSPYFPGIDLSALFEQCVRAAGERGTGAATRELRRQIAART
ncbi:Uma2 family endonuclease [Gloeobacter violaceus]|uniref:Glr3200 protein n=1 Tax=Gloeobacter violaceus (strain ATCC 29082 / PCC 7421) TaxID=251221 RepID=Q7NGG9_GLOVI|nr:Uma2 family endonuclease [Gloeobacter violaceus]BAC91141.1 glr3200 [Gloeobacter violaceus PCC 7421]